MAPWRMLMYVVSNWVFATATFGTSGAFANAMFASLNASIAAFNPPGGVVWSIALEPLPAVLQAASRARGGNIFGLEPGNGNAFSILCLLSFHSLSHSPMYFIPGADV